MNFAILENRFAILRNIKDRFAICDLRSVNSDREFHMRTTCDITTCGGSKFTCDSHGVFDMCFFHKGIPMAYMVVFFYELHN